MPPLTAPLILALDISKTCTGVAEGRAGEKPLSYSIRGKDFDTVGAVCHLGKWLIDKTAVDKPDWIFFEAPLHMGAFVGQWDPGEQRVKATSNPDTIITLAKMVGIVEFIASMRHISARTANVHSVRKAFIGARCKGPEAKRRCFEMSRVLGWDPKNRDESDALAVHFFATISVAPNLAPIITPMMQAKVASTIGGVEIDDPADLLFANKRGAR